MIYFVCENLSVFLFLNNGYPLFSTVFTLILSLLLRRVFKEFLWEWLWLNCWFLSFKSFGERFKSTLLNFSCNFSKLNWRLFRLVNQSLLMLSITDSDKCFSHFCLDIKFVTISSLFDLIVSEELLDLQDLIVLLAVL